MDPEEGTMPQNTGLTSRKRVDFRGFTRLNESLVLALGWTLMSPDTPRPALGLEDRQF